MTRYTYPQGDRQAVIEVPDGLEGYYDAQPGYARVLTDAEKAEQAELIHQAALATKGDDLKAAREQAGVDPALSADDARAELERMARAEVGLPEVAGDAELVDQATGEPHVAVDGDTLTVTIGDPTTPAAGTEEN